MIEILIELGLREMRGIELETSASNANLNLNDRTFTPSVKLF